MQQWHPAGVTKPAAVFWNHSSFYWVSFSSGLTHFKIWKKVASIRTYIQTDLEGDWEPPMRLWKLILETVYISSKFRRNVEESSYEASSSFHWIIEKKTNRLKSMIDGECDTAVVAASVQVRSVRASHLREDVVDGGAKRGTDRASWKLKIICGLS